ncbi:AMP-binding protein [Leisingera sp. ANG59]|uniref:AMP-binding protein n=1 Tax=Leisingera sp. ANG59 TaxID=2675221 RepID=UPI00157398BE|nr:AMP-binding protein [Leisingera sp. ANG59]NSY41327.1 AMP-binding protein [Leisingera sp. ANG59]
MTATDLECPIDLLEHWARTRPQSVYLRQPEHGKIREMTWATVWDQTRRMASALLSMGLEGGDRVAIIAKNSAEWFIADFAIQAAGLVSAPVYPTASPETIQYILEHSESKVAFIGKLDDMTLVKSGLPEDITTIAMPYPTLHCDHRWQDLIETHDPLQPVARAALDDLLTIVYTSGSTGKPKGVELTCRNMAYGGKVPMEKLELRPEDRLISYLPLAHAFERGVIEHGSLYHGASVSFVDSLDTFADDLRNAAPTIFQSVPRLWMKFHSGVLGKMPQRKLDLLLRLPVLGNVVRKKIKTQLGLQNARICISGSAPISPAILHWFEKLGINISEGWGMTETGGASTVNYPYRADKVGTIGDPMPGTEIKISAEGEILIRGDGVFSCYHKEPEKTEEVLSNGWLHTGDKGEIDSDGYVRITGRVKDVFKTAKGKYVAPVPIESLLFEDQHVEQVCVVGSGLPQPVAITVLSHETTDAVSEHEIRQSLSQSLDRVNAQLERHEQLGRIIVVPDAWTVENELLTPTMKIKRELIEEKYESVVAMPADSEVVLL